MMIPKVSIAYFVSSHGFGHASRSCAVMNALHERCPVFHFTIFSQTPQWFFSQSLKPSFDCHPLATDVGLIQTSALDFDVQKTLDALNLFFPFDDIYIDGFSQKIKAIECQMALCDISPLGIAVAKRAGIPGVLVENFTWDWIYENYASTHRSFHRIINYIKDVYARADYRIQADPACNPIGGSLLTPPIARVPVSTRQETRARLGIEIDEKMVLITLGGIQESLQCVRQISDYHDGVRFVVPGAANQKKSYAQSSRNIIFLPQMSEFYHPDLVNAADAVIGKVGYSTMAEVYHACVPFGYVGRSNFRESTVMASYIRDNMKSMPISVDEFHEGVWLNRLPELLSLGVEPDHRQNGAGIAAEYICKILRNDCELIEIVDNDCAVIGVAPRNKVHGKNHWIHRVVHVLVFDSKNKLLLQKRSMNKIVAPGKWDTSVGGHVDFEESTEDALYREMSEELGIRPESLQFIYDYIHKNDFESEHVSTYVCVHDGDVKFNAKEIDDVKFWEISEIDACLGKGIFSDNFEDEFKKYCVWLKTAKEYS